VEAVSGWPVGLKTEAKIRTTAKITARIIIIKMIPFLSIGY
jgi:hypothetical protein